MHGVGTDMPVGNGIFFRFSVLSHINDSTSAARPGPPPSQYTVDAPVPHTACNDESTARRRRGSGLLITPMITALS